VASSQPKTILVDHRWGQVPQAWKGQAPQAREDFVEELRQLGYNPIVRQLGTGDLIWSAPVGRVGVELKCLRDLLTSLSEGRLDDELMRLRLTCTLAILCITDPLGYEADIPAGRFTFDSIDNMLVGRQNRGVLVARTAGEESLAQRIHSLVRYLDRPQQKLLRPKKVHFPYMGKLTDRAEVIYALLASVKGIRDKAAIAERLAAQPLARVFSYRYDDWRGCGFSKLMAQRLEQHLMEVA